jgi:hypothetical protein
MWPEFVISCHLFAHARHSWTVASDREASRHVPLRARKVANGVRLGSGHGFTALLHVG